MCPRMISLREADAKSLRSYVERMMAYWTNGGSNPYRICGFCHNSDDFRGRLNHSASCQGEVILNLLDSKIEEIDEEMDVLRVADLMEMEEVEPNVAIAAIHWLSNTHNHGMETRTVMRAIRSIKEKLGIPF